MCKHTQSVGNNACTYYHLFSWQASLCDKNWDINKRWARSHRNTWVCDSWTHQWHVSLHPISNQLPGCFPFSLQWGGSRATFSEVQVKGRGRERERWEAVGDQTTYYSDVNLLIQRQPQERSLWMSQWEAGKWGRLWHQCWPGVGASCMMELSIE